VPNPAAPAKAQTVGLSTFPFFHIAGLCGLNNNTLNGVCIITQYKWDAGDALRIVEKYKVNVFGGVPTVVRSFLEHPDFSKFDLSSISAIGQGGAPVPPDSVATIEAEFAGKVNASNGYGLTETTAAVIGNSGAAYFAKKDSVGLPYVGTQIRIAAEDGTEVRQGDIGEVWVYGPNNVRGYWNKPEETKKAFTDGWFHTGDLAVMEPDRYVKIKDRSKDIIISGGENISSLEVEDALYRHPAVLACAVVAKPDAKWGETPLAYVETRAGSSVTSADLVAHCRQWLAGYKVPKDIRFESIPKTSTGKIQKFQLRQRTRTDASATDLTPTKP
jgi:long-chain acyl-CoA synthetase